MNFVDYSKYTDHELQESLGSINKDEYPENYKKLSKEIENRKNRTEPFVKNSSNQITNYTELETTQPLKKEIPLPNDRIQNLKYVAYILFLNSVLLLLQILFSGNAEDLKFTSPMVIDLIFGILLLKKPSDTIVGVLAFRTILGLIWHSISFLVEESYFMMLFQMIYCGCLLFLMFKIPTKKQRNILVGFVMGLQILFVSISFSNIVISKNLNSLYSLLDEPVKIIEGVWYEYQLPLPNNNWFLREAKVAVESNPNADQWAVNPELDAHIIIIGEKLETGQSITMLELKETVIQNIKNIASNFKLLEEYSTNNENHDGLVIHSRAKVNFVDAEYITGLYILGEYVFQVTTFCGIDNLEKLKKEFNQIINSFEFKGEINIIHNKTLSSIYFNNAANKVFKPNLLLGA